MHAAVLSYVGRWATTDPIRILDIGGRDVNGTPRHLFPNAHYLSIDKMPGPGVDRVIDATYPPERWHTYDLILCLEVLEHCPHYWLLLTHAFLAAVEGGRFVVTCAGPGRSPHSEIDGGSSLLDSEWYRNVTPAMLRGDLERSGWDVVECFQSGEDVRAMAVKPS